MLVLVTGNSGTGKSTLCTALRRRGLMAVDADGDGYCRWTDRSSGAVVEDPPDPVPAGWLHAYGWQIDRSRVAALSADARGAVAFLCGSAENESDVLDLVDLVVCLVIDERTLRERLTTRRTNSFGRHPEELAAALADNGGAASAYRALGAVVVDATEPLATVVDAVVEASQPDRD